MSCCNNCNCGCQVPICLNCTSGCCNNCSASSCISCSSGTCCGCNSTLSAVPADANCDPCATTENCCSSAVAEAIGNFPVYIETTAAFNMPACDTTGNIKVRDAQRFAPGSLIFALGVGYLVITAVPDNDTLTVRNDCSSCNILNPGEFVAVGTSFIVGPPVCGDPTAGGGNVATIPFLACDFTIPANGACAAAKVTTVVSLFIGDLVSINGFQYRIESIPDATTIVICNDGQGGTENDVIKADENNDQVPDHAIIRVGGQNPCLITPTQVADLILGCDGGAESALAGVVDDQVPAWSEGNSQWELKVIQDLAICVTLDGCLQIDTAAPPTQSYLIDILPDTTGLQEEFDKLPVGAYLAVEINGDPFCVSEIVDINTIRVIPFPAQPGDPKYDEGSVLCIDECCDQCRPVILGLDDFNAQQGNPELILIGSGGIVEFLPIGTGVSSQSLPASIATLGQSGVEAGAESLWEITIMNNSKCRKYIKLHSNFQYATDIIADVDMNVSFRLLKTSAPADTQAFSSKIFEGGRAVIAGASAFDLVVGFPTLNTWENAVADRDIIEIGEVATYKGHIRQVFDNASGAPVPGGAGNQYVYAWRAWIEAMDFDFADATTVP